MISITDNIQFVPASFHYVSGVQHASVFAVDDAKCKPLPSAILVQNEPSPGFRILKPSYTQGNWIVFDPRGFTVDVPSHCIQKILSESAVVNTLIHDECVWIRHSANKRLELVTTNTEKYKQAVETTCYLKKKVSLRDVQKGDTVLLSSGARGIYLGKTSMYVTESPYHGVYTQRFGPISFTQRFAYKFPAPFTGSPCILLTTTHQILTVINRAQQPYTEDECLTELNLPGNKFIFHHESVTSMFHNIRCTVKNLSKKAYLRFTEVTETQAYNIVNDAINTRCSVNILMEDENKNLYIPETRSIRHTKNTLEFMAFNIKQVDLTNNTEVAELCRLPGSFSTHINKFVKFYSFEPFLNGKPL